MLHIANPQVLRTGASGYATDPSQDRHAADLLPYRFISSDSFDDTESAGAPALSKTMPGSAPVA